MAAMAEIAVEAGGVTLAGEEDGEGTPVVLLHGLTASRRALALAYPSGTARDDVQDRKERMKEVNETLLDGDARNIIEQIVNEVEAMAQRHLRQS